MQGVLLSVPEAMEDMTAMKRLWVHEILRVYGDRLVDDADRIWLVSAVHDVSKDRLGEDVDVIFERLASPGIKYVSNVESFNETNFENV